MPALKSKGLWGGSLLAIGALDRIIGWGGSADFIVSRSQDPGWLRTVVTFLELHGPGISTIMLIAGFALIIWNERTRSAAEWRRLEKKIDAHYEKADQDYRDILDRVEKSSAELNAKLDDLEIYYRQTEQHNAMKLKDTRKDIEDSVQRTLSHAQGRTDGDFNRVAGLIKQLQIGLDGLRTRGSDSLPQSPQGTEPETQR